jgi:hypothetical protein
MKKILLFGFLTLGLTLSCKVSWEVERGYHPEGWLSIHGEMVEKELKFVEDPDSISCYRCHLPKGDFEEAPSCLSCHKELPE